MKVVLLALFLSLSACAAEPVKKTEAVAQPAAPVAKAEEKKKEEPPKPINVPARQKVIAHIDPTTMKVTYDKGTDPKLVIESVTDMWANNVRELTMEYSRQIQACQQQLAAKDAKK